MIKVRRETGRRVMRSQASLVLLGTLLFAIITISGFTIVLLRGQRLILEETVRESESGALIFLANRIEQAVLLAIRPPFRALKNLPLSDGGLSERFHWMRQRFPEIEQCLILDAAYRVRANYAPQETAAENVAIYERLTQRLKMEAFDNAAQSYGFRGSVEIISGRPSLLVWQPLDDADRRKGWLAIGFSLARLQDRYIAPLLDEFRRTHTGTVQLKDAEAERIDAPLSWPIGRVLPGWTLTFAPDPQAGAAHLRQAHLLTIGVASAVLLAMLAATFAVWWEIRRERALLELRNRFIANVSHELRTPLALIKMYTETLYLGRVSDEARRSQYYQTMLRECDRLSRMIENALGFSRTSKGFPGYRLTETDIAGTVARVVEDYEPKVTEKGLRLQVHLQPNLPPVPHDPHGITQILLNLIDNSVKYAADGKLVMVGLVQHDSQVQLKVTDRGQGVVAQRGEEKPGTGRAPVAGIGLGLDLVQQIASAHGATFALRSVPGASGTEAVVSFPFKVTPQ